MDTYNIGTERDQKELVEKVGGSIGFDGMVEWGHVDDERSTPPVSGHHAWEKRLGFEAQVGLDEGLRRTIEWYAPPFGAKKELWVNPFEGQREYDVDASLGPAATIQYTHNLSTCIARHLDRWIVLFGKEAA